MKKFSVVVSKLEYATVEVEAENIEEAVDKVMESDTTEFDELDWRLAECDPYSVEQVDEMDPEPCQRMSLVDKLTAVKGMIEEMEKEMIMQGLLASEPKEE